ncbi:unnamed protein product [Rotaria socialis]|uniref:Uncharacterized protein n=1 Tax=Rotaria socialis TaxID=392032 RepID=A0A821L4W4_9BILA|nr:unnamed protein product [Rotaria socialis]CAF4745659.1 unnamed protein product [Rotaria socialis]
MSSSFETLPDEILMIIIRYSGNFYSIFRTFCGLNQRLNRILIDRRLHLLTDFLCIDNHTADAAEYYNSPLFRVILQKVCSLRSHELDTELRSCFQHRERFQSIRANLHPDEIDLQDSTLKKTFNEFNSTSSQLEIVHRLRTLVLQTGARLAPYSAQGAFNLAVAINRYLLAYSSTLRDSHRSHAHSIVEMFKALIISNPNLVHNVDDGDRSGPIYLLLIDGIYRLKSFYSSSSAISINVPRYQAIIELLLFVIHCLRHVFNRTFSLISDLLNNFQCMNSIDNDIDKQIIIETSQIEICNILFEEFSRKELVLDEYWDHVPLERGLKNLMVTSRVDAILSVGHQEKFLQVFFQCSDHGVRLLNMMTRNRTGRLLFQRLLDEKHLKSWFATIKLLFILLDKKERKLIKKLLRLIPALVQEIDDDSNDALLYICLKVAGCRHKLVAFLIQMGCDVHRKNIHGEHFFQALQLRKNRTLLERLIEHEIIVKDDETGLFQVTFGEG